jgi:hypothetical protein
MPRKPGWPAARRKAEADVEKDIRSKGGKLLFGKKDAAKAIGAMLPVLALASLGTVFDSPATAWRASLVKRLGAIEDKLNQVVSALGAVGKQPAAFTIRWRKPRLDSKITPETAFLRAVTLGVPFEVNGTLYRPTRARRRK